jgi:hypothetical protein
MLLRGRHSRLSVGTWPAMLAPGARRPAGHACAQPACSHWMGIRRHMPCASATSAAWRCFGPQQPEIGGAAVDMRRRESRRDTGSPWASGDGGSKAEDGAGWSCDGDVRSRRCGRTGKDQRRCTGDADAGLDGDASRVSGSTRERGWQGWPHPRGPRLDVADELAAVDADHDVPGAGRG